MRKGWRRHLTLIGVLVVLFGSAYHFYPTISGLLFLREDLNVLLISVDTARADHFSFNGYPVGLTPNIDQLAASGVLFRRAYCYAGNTTASMAGIFTSKFPYWPLEVDGGGPRWQAETGYGLTRFFPSGELLPGIPDSLETLPTIYKRHGYTTIGISTNPYLTRDFNFDRGFDFFEEFSQKSSEPYASAEDVVEKLEVYLSELRGEKFFAWIHFMDLHWPLRDYGPFLEETKSRGIRAAPNHLPVSEWTQEAVKAVSNFGARNLLDWKPTEEGLRQALEKYILAYDAELLRIDKQIGVISERLKQYGLWDNTLVVIVTDHGEEFVEHGNWDHRGQLYEAIVRGVWIMHNPKVFRTPVVVDDRVSLIDVLPTLLELQGISGNRLSFDGISRVSLLEKNHGEENGFVFGILDRRAYVIDGDHKLIVNGDYGKEDRGAHPEPPREPLELYDLKNDPGEHQNIAGQFPQIADKLFIKLKYAFLKKGIRFWESTPSKEVSKKTQERLKALGYVQ